MPDTRIYLGDGAYATLDARGLVLTTEDGVRVTNTVVLGPDEWGALLNFVARHTAPLAARNRSRS